MRELLAIINDARNRLAELAADIRAGANLGGAALVLHDIAKDLIQAALSTSGELLRKDRP